MTRVRLAFVLGIVVLLGAFSPIYAATTPVDTVNVTGEWGVNQTGWTIRDSQIYNWNTYSGDGGTYSWKDAPYLGSRYEWQDGGDNTLNIFNDGAVTGSAETILGSHNRLNMSGGRINANITMHDNDGGPNALYLTGGTLVTGYTVDVGYGATLIGAGTINGTISSLTAGQASYYRQFGGTVAAGGVINIGGTGSTFRLDSNTTFHGTANISDSGNNGLQTVIVDNAPGITIDGLIDMSSVAGVGNQVILANGTIDGADGTMAGSVIGSDGGTTFYIGKVVGYDWYNFAPPAMPSNLLHNDPMASPYYPLPGTPVVNNTNNLLSPTYPNPNPDYGNALAIKQIYGGTGVATLNVVAGQAYNIWLGVNDNTDAAQADVIQVGSVINYMNGKAVYNEQMPKSDPYYDPTIINDHDYLAYTILGANVINIGNNNQDPSNPSPSGQAEHARVVIGAIADSSNNNTYEAVDLSTRDFANSRQAQITADTVNVYANSKLTLHQNYDAYTSGDFTATDPRRNIIDKLNVLGISGNVTRCNVYGYIWDMNSPAKAFTTIDRTTVHVTDNGTPTVHPANDYANYNANTIIGVNGVLQGFGRITDMDNHDPRAPNIMGDNGIVPVVAIQSGGLLRMYDPQLLPVHWGVTTNEAQYLDNERNASQLKGVYFKVDGTTRFEHASHFSTRLFGVDDTYTTETTSTIVSDGLDSNAQTNPLNPNFIAQGQPVTVRRSLGDGLISTDIIFDEIKYNSIYYENNYHTLFGGYTGAGTKKDLTDLGIWSGVAQQYKVQYDPIFGIDNELKSKLEFNLYEGGADGVTSHYFKIMHSDNPINALVNMPDANHVFNRDILVSDMLGQWYFEKSTDDRDVVLRYRLLIDHPQNGGILNTVTERNSVEAGKKLDEIRYPFWTATSWNDSTLPRNMFISDPSLDSSANYWGEQDSWNIWNYYNNGNDNGNPYNVAGFDGNIEKFYADPTKYGYPDNPFRTNPAVDPNYNMAWVHDIDTYFRALQLEATSAANVTRAIRLVTAEAYASQSSADLNTMNQFIASRERNGVSALYLVEEKERLQAEADGGTQYRQELERDMPSSFVANPLRVWTAFLGNHSKQRRNGDEYGYTAHQNGGLQLGVIKEAGDFYFGLTGAYVRGTNRWAELQAKNRADSYMAEALLGWRRGMGFVELSLNAGYMDHKMTRNIELGEDLHGGAYVPELDCNLGDNYYNGVYRVTHTGNFHNRVLGGGLRFGYQKVFAGKWLFLPTVGAYYQDVRNPKAFVEDGPDNAAFRLVMDKGGIKRQTLQIPVMLRLSRGIAFNNAGPWVLMPEVRVGATANALDKGGKAYYQWLGNPIPNRVMKAWGLEDDRVSYQAGATLELSRRGRFYAALNYDINLWSKSVGHNFSLQSGLNF